MATHLCESPQELSWDQIKKLVQGNKSCANRYICGGCSSTFETICCLHVHCMKHNGGGSYYFDHVTNTAFPKFDTSCRAALFDAGDIKGSQEQRILKGNPVNINRNKDFKRVDQRKETARATDESTVCSNKDEFTHAENDASDFCIEQADLEHVGENETTGERSEKDSYSTVKVRNVERKADGSVTFEMHEDDAHLFQITASTIIEKLKEMGEFFLENRQELEVLIPVGHVSETSPPLSQSTYKPVRIESNKKSVDETPAFTPTTQKTSKDSIKSTQSKGNSAALSNPEEQEVTKFHSTDQDKGKNECNDDGVFNGELQDVDAGSEEVYVNKEKTDIQKHEIIENLNLTPVNSVHVPRLKERNSRTPVTEKEQKATGKKHEDSAVEYSGRTRPERKRKLTTKMKESELSETLRFANRNSLSTDENESVKPRKSNRKGKVDKSKDDDEHDNVKPRCDKQAAAVEMTVCIEKERKQARADNMSNTYGNDFCSEEILITEGALSVVDSDLGFTVHEQNIKSLDKETVQSDDMSFDSETYSVSFQDARNAGKKSTQNIRKKHRRKNLDDGKLPTYKRKDFKCGVCGKIGSMNMIKYHQQMHSNKMPYKCEVCGKCFKTAACKRGHLRQHGEKKWKCDQCPAAFFRKQYLEMHMTNHTGEMPFMCEICGMKFRMAYIVRRHVNSVHKNIRNYKCEICEKTFFRAATRDEHLKRHYEPQLQCTFCPKKFKAELDLRKHELTHTGEKQFFCPVCSQGFTQIWPYYRHMWKIHNVQKEEAKKVRIKNPDIVYMRNVNKDAGKKDPGYVHEFIGKPGCTFDMRKSFSQNVRNNSIVESENMSAGEHFVYTRSSASGVCREQGGADAVYMEGNSDLTDAIVLDIGDDLNSRETIVIQAEDLQNADNQQTGYIVVKDAKSGENIIIYSEFPQSEIEDSREHSETVDKI